MAWVVMSTEAFVGSDKERWEIELLLGETKIETPPMGRVLHGVLASAHREGEWQFQVLVWVPQERVDLVQQRVLAEARRRIETADFEPGQTYEAH